MLTRLETAWAGARADSLAFTLDEEPLPPLAVLPVRVGDLEVELRLLGSAHQVVAGPVVETVAALPHRPGPLPYRLRREVGGWAHIFTADVYRRGPADFERAVSFLRSYLERRDDAIVGVHAGAEGVVSGLLLKPVRRGLDWRGWHTFPEGRQIVVTRSRMLVH